MSANYATLSARIDGRWTVVRTVPFDDAFEGDAAASIGGLLTEQGQYMPHAKIAVHSKANLRKDLAKLVVEVGK